jgi:hypothetical protein
MNSRFMATIAGRIARRILVNFRVKPDALVPFVPAGFRPKLVNGWGMAGICLIRVEQVRPRGLPRWCGVSSENAAHRIAVEWDGDGDGATREGVFIPRRDTDRWFNRMAGGRLFPGSHHAARFQVSDNAQRISVGVGSDDGAMTVSVSGRPTDTLPNNSIFHSVEEASAFFQAGSLGWSPTRDGRQLEGLELHCPAWHMTPLAVDEVESSFFSKLGPAAFFDSAFLMRNLDHEWHASGRRETFAASCVCPS